MLDTNQSGSVISLVDTVLSVAIEKGVSDIHFEPTQEGLRVRFRIDGVLVDQPSIQKEIMLQVVSRLKVLGQINIAERRIPQDGKFHMPIHDRAIDLRVSTFPSIYGQKVVVRILDRAVHMVSLTNLGFESSMLDCINQLIKRQSGFFLVTGPTGSGKTTTLYAALAALNSPEKNIVTLEDPIEYHLSGITQGQVNSDIGFTFDQGVRSVLRQDPDIIMVGEIRDRQTAHAAIEAALTGHFVLSTLHTNDAPSAIMRLMDMAIEPFLINASLTGVLAQRLARTICTNCKIQIVPTDEQKLILEQFDIAADSLYRGTGCSRCDQLGYKGRTGIFELLVMTDAARRLIIKQPNLQDLLTQARIDGMQGLRASAAEKVCNGSITLEEMIRVVV